MLLRYAQAVALHLHETGDRMLGQRHVEGPVQSDVKLDIRAQTAQ